MVQRPTRTTQSASTPTEYLDNVLRLAAFPTGANPALLQNLRASISQLSGHTSPHVQRLRLNMQRPSYTNHGQDTRVFNDRCLSLVTDPARQMEVDPQAHSSVVRRCCTARGRMIPCKPTEPAVA